MLKLPVNEIFTSIQGEGYFSGTPAIFIRFQGCHVNCDFCDTRYASFISKENRLESINKFRFKCNASPSYYEFTEETLIDYMMKYFPPEKCIHLVITGGEPLMHDINNLLKLLRNNGYFVQVETSGCYKIECGDDAWITLSPKKCCICSNYYKADEVKVIVNEKTNFSKIDWSNCNIYLQPESCRPEMIRKAVAMAIEKQCRLSIQIHKYISLK